MCGDENCHEHDCHCEHDNCDYHEHEHEIYNWYKEWDVVWEVDFQIVNKDELENMKDRDEIWWNLWDDLVNMGFINEDDDLYKEMINEKRDWMFYDE